MFFAANVHLSTKGGGGTCTYGWKLALSCSIYGAFLLPNMRMVSNSTSVLHYQKNLVKFNAEVSPQFKKNTLTTILFNF